jgi:5''/3''-nucleotidase SurE
MKILVTNDDGIDTPGLWAAVKELHKVGEVRVIAPWREQSGVGASITLRQSIKVNKVTSQLNGVEAYSVEGTPADCVIVGIRSLFSGEIDLVVSGINRGPNIGHDVFVSGTVGAALQGYLRGIPSLAISVNGYEDLDFEASARIAALLAVRIKNGMLPRQILLNVNLPNLPAQRISGIEITELSKQSYCDTVERDQNSEGAYYRIKRNNKDKNGYYANRETDIWALQLNRGSITPLLNSSDVNPLEAHLQDLAHTIYSELCCY